MFSNTKILPLNAIECWKYSTWLLATLFFLFSFRWSLIDQSPPRWDESMYMVQATSLYSVLVQQGFLAFVDSVFSIAPGKVPLLVIIVQPGFLIWGPTLDVAVMTINLFWFVLAWAISGLARDFFGESELTNKLAFFAFLVLGLSPLTTMLSHYFLVELLLISLVCASMHALWRTYKGGGLRWSLASGILVGLGMLTKVTFPVFILPSALVLCFSSIRSGSWRVLFSFCIVVLLALLIAGPYYWLNFSSLYEMSVYLSSHELAQLYKFGDVFNLTTIVNYWLSIFYNPTMILVVVFAFIGLIVYASGYNRINQLVIPLWPGRMSGLLLGLWFVIPFLLATFGEIKDARYLYPGLVPLFLFAAWALSSITLVAWGKVFVAGAIVLPAGYFLASNIALMQGVLAGGRLPDLPDSRNWRVNEVVHNAFREISADNLPHEILFLGGSRYYHSSLFKYEGLIVGEHLNYSTLPYYSDVEMNVDSALRYINEKGSSAILHKSGKNWPEFSSRLDTEIVEKLRADVNRVAIDLGVEQPDGSRFTLFLRVAEESDKICLSALEEISSTERSVLEKTVQFGNLYRLEAVTVKDVNDVRKVTLVWQSLRKQRLRHTNFIHLLDAQMNILGGYDRMLNSKEVYVDKCDKWSNTVELAADLLIDKMKLGLGLYIPPSVGDALFVMGGAVSDWDGRRLIVDLD